jgi:hypothetical protein
MKQSVLQCLRSFFSTCHSSHRERAAALTIVEVEELEHIFALLLFGSFVGFPSPPSFLSVQLLPLMEKELVVLNERAKIR